jgi:hypothetical protein
VTNALNSAGMGLVLQAVSFTRNTRWAGRRGIVFLLAVVLAIAMGGVGLWRCL